MSDQYQSAFPDDGEGQLGEPAREDRRSDDERREDAEQAGLDNAIENASENEDRR